MQKTPSAPRPRVFEKPVAWLFGPQLIGGLKGILLYTAYGDKLDPRDWMTGEVFSFDDAEKQKSSGSTTSLTPATAPKPCTALLI